MFLPHKTITEDFLDSPGTIFDVRSPGEFAQGHIPGAVNLPLFSNEERAAVGTIYKQQGQKAAISLGLTLTGPKLADLVAQATLLTDGGALPAKVYCARGGMRSGALSWLLEFAGIKTIALCLETAVVDDKLTQDFNSKDCVNVSSSTAVFRLQGGYKTFRRWVLSQFDIPRHITILGGMTGSGKTSMLDRLKEKGHQVLNLEAIANHRGSAFGKIGMCGSQPSTEHFENEIGVLLAKSDPSRPLWIEDESRMIGTCCLPTGIFEQMRRSPMIFIDIPREERIQRLMAEYGQFPAEQLALATERIGRHLGGQRKNEALSYIAQGNILQALEIVLDYYDKSYTHAQAKYPRSVTKVNNFDQLYED
ncbi:MAG: tRNA 2-selenouridine(34) synthase MnmH [Parachlamydiaceae bacterium]